MWLAALALDKVAHAVVAVVVMWVAPDYIRAPVCGTEACVEVVGAVGSSCLLGTVKWSSTHANPAV